MTPSPRQLEEIRQKLDQRYNELLAEIRSGGTKAGIAPGGNAADAREADERLSGIQAEGIADAELGRDWHELEQVQRAIGRLDAGSYGTCADCGKPIPLERLLTAPASIRCVECQDLHERDAARARRG